MKNKSDYQYLKESPLFHFSLHSKELFHSNVIAWIAMDPELRDVFRNVLVSGFGMDKATVLSWGDNFEVLREKNNFDLVIKAYDEKKKANGKDKIVPGQWYAVIENKIKSIPTKEQLDKYTAKINEIKGIQTENVDKCLLVLVSTLLDLPDGWRVVTYKNIVDAVNGSLENISDPYKKAIIEDYIGMTKCLINIASNQDFSLDIPYLAKLDEELNTLRISDLIGKRRVSDIANRFSKEINRVCGFGYTKGQPLVEIHCPVENEDIKIGIQIQGDQYRIFIEGKIAEFEITERSKGLLKKDRATFRTEMISKHPDIFEEMAIQGECNKPFCEYKGNDGKSFWYQYVKIKPNATTAQIMDCFADDVKTIEKTFNINSDVETCQ